MRIFLQWAIECEWARDEVWGAIENALCKSQLAK